MIRFTFTLFSASSSSQHTLALTYARSLTALHHQPVLPAAAATSHHGLWYVHVIARWSMGFWLFSPDFLAFFRGCAMNRATDLVCEAHDASIWTGDASD
jgi:hypothetical protein